MAHNLDDQFDLADQADNKKLKQDMSKKGKSKSYATNDFDDLEDNDKGIKLPALNNKTVNNNPQKSTKSLQKVNLQEVNVKKGSNNLKGKYQQDQSLEEILEQSVAPYTSPLKKKTEETQSRKKINTQFLKQKEVKKEEKYEEEYEIQQNEPEQSYGQDFETHEEKQPSPIIYKAKEQKNSGSKKSLNTINIPKLPEKNTKAPLSVAKKIDNSARVYSRTSARSQDRSAQSKTRVEQRKEDLPNKYTSIVQKTCPNYDRAALEQLGMDKLNRQNQRIRNTIKKFNDELNDMINKNIMLLKGKKEEKVVAQDEIVKQLQEQIASNQTQIQTTTRDLAKLKDKQGSIKGESYHLALDQQISEAKTTITEITKSNIKLNSQIANQGNKLSKMDKEKSTSANVPNIQIGNIKNGIANAKKDDEKNEETNKKLDLKLQELAKKTAEIQQKINGQLEEAKQKGINVIINPEMLKKRQQLKKKIDIGKQHKGKTQALFKTKCELIVHQIDQIKALIRQVEHNTSICQTNCQEVQSQSKKTVEKARKGGRMSLDMLNSLEIIINEMERGIPSSKQTDDQALLSQPKGAKKYQSLKSVQKIHPTMPVGENQKSQDDSNAKKPVIFKKKKQQQEKLDQRIWKQQKTLSPPKNDKNRQSALQLAKFQDKEVERKEEQKKKPFVIKKKQKVSQEKIQILKQQVKQTHKQETIKQQPKSQAPSIAPRMMKFKRNKDEQESKPVQSNDKNIQSIVTKERQNNSIKNEQKQQDESPNIAPRRFNLKLKDRKNEQAGYTASNLQKKQQTKAEEPKQIQTNIYKKQPINLSNPIEPSPMPQVEEQKPKISLRLRDRQKQTNNLESKPEQKHQSIRQHIQQVTAKIAITLNDNPAPLKQNNNPYAQQQQVSRRERQGLLKKQKQNQSIPKQQFNIYEQAQDLTNIKEIHIQQPKQIQVSSKDIKPSHNNIESNEELDLNKLLGINKPKRQVQQDLLVDTKILGRKKQTKKDTNFFGQLQL